MIYRFKFKFFIDVQENTFVFVVYFPLGWVKGFQVPSYES